LQPGGANGGWLQPVPLVHTRIGDGGDLGVTQRGTVTKLTPRTDIYGRTVRAVDHIDIQNAPVVFVGYGVVAPERQWDDFKGFDVKNKVIVMLVNDPDFEAVPSEKVY